MEKKRKNTYKTVEELVNAIEDMINSHDLHMTAYKIEVHHNIIYGSGPARLIRGKVERSRAVDESIWDTEEEPDIPSLDKHFTYGANTRSTEGRIGVRRIGTAPIYTMGKEGERTQ